MSKASQETACALSPDAPHLLQRAGRVVAVLVLGRVDYDDSLTACLGSCKLCMHLPRPDPNPHSKCVNPVGDHDKKLKRGKQPPTQNDSELGYCCAVPNCWKRTPVHVAAKPARGSVATEGDGEAEGQ